MKRVSTRAPTAIILLMRLSARLLAELTDIVPLGHCLSKTGFPGMANPFYLDFGHF
jgi:hypothetical protein